MTGLILFGVGYVLGAKAGRPRYDQIRSLADQAAETLDSMTRGR